MLVSLLMSFRLTSHLLEARLRLGLDAEAEVNAYDDRVLEAEDEEASFDSWFRLVQAFYIAFALINSRYLGQRIIFSLSFFLYLTLTLALSFC